MVQADYDNDGDLDVLVLRGAWFGAAGQHPNSLLHNRGTAPLSTRPSLPAWGNTTIPPRPPPGRITTTTETSMSTSGMNRPTSCMPPASCSATRGTAPLSTWRPRPASSTTSSPRGRCGATTTETACRTCTCRTWAGPTACIATEGTARSPMWRRSWGYSALCTVSRPGSGISTTTAPSTCSWRPMPRESPQWPPPTSIGPTSWSRPGCTSTGATGKGVFRSRQGVQPAPSHQAHGGQLRGHRQ